MQHLPRQIYSLQNVTRNWENAKCDDVNNIVAETAVAVGGKLIKDVNRR